MQQPGDQTKAYWHQYQAFFPAHWRISSDNGNIPDEEVFAWRGARIHLDCFAVDQPAATVILVHGAGGYGRMLAPIGARLQAAGYRVIAPDLPGYGLTEAPHALITYTAWVDLLCALVRREREQTGRPVVLCGGSLGGYLTYLTAARLERGMVAGVIATTLADPRTALVKRQFTRNGLMRAMLPLLPVSAFVFGRLKLPVKWFTRMQAMSNDPALSRLVAADPLGGGRRVPLALLRSIFAIQPDVEPEHFQHCPVLLVHPADDRWTGIASSAAFLDRLAGPRQMVMLENCGHFPVEQPGLQQLEQAAVAFLRQLVPGA